MSLRPRASYSSPAVRSSLIITSLALVFINTVYHRVSFVLFKILSTSSSASDQSSPNYTTLPLPSPIAIQWALNPLPAMLVSFPIATVQLATLALSPAYMFICQKLTAAPTVTLPVNITVGAASVAMSIPFTIRVALPSVYDVVWGVPSLLANSIHSSRKARPLTMMSKATTPAVEETEVIPLMRRTKSMPTLHPRTRLQSQPRPKSHLTISMGRLAFSLSFSVL